MAASLLALGLDPERCTLFVQSHRPEHTELAWLLMTVTPVSWLERTPTYKEKKANQPDDINHGLLTYPVLQAADIVIYKASMVPVGKDQAAHLELSREIVRAFNARYGETFPEPKAVFTEAPVVLGTDGVKKMSKSVGNTIDVFASEDVIRKQVMSMVTDTKRILRTDPGRPEVCNVCQLQPLVRRRLRGAVGGRAHRPDRLRRHEAAAGRADHPPLRRRRASAISSSWPTRTRWTASWRPAPIGSSRWPRRPWRRSGSGWACDDDRRPTHLAGTTSVRCAADPRGHRALLHRRRPGRRRSSSSSATSC